MYGHLRPASEMPFQWHFAGWPMVVRFVYWIGFLLVILAQTPSNSVKEVDDTTICRNFALGTPLTKLSGYAY